MAESLPSNEIPEVQATRTDFLAGILLGLLVGGLVGLSVSPLAGDVLAGLVAMLTAFFGLGGKLPVSVGVTKVRLLAFCVGVLIGVPGSILIRTNGLLAPSIEYRIAEYTAAGLDGGLAKDLAIFDHTGLRVGTLASTPDPSDRYTLPIAFSAASAAQCSSLQSAFFSSSQARLQAMAASDAPWDQAGQFGLALPVDQHAAFADYIHDIFCTSTE